MQKINYNLKMKDIISHIDGKPKLLLHSCCAPCSTSVLELLKDNFDISIYYYNPNIHPKEEYDIRLDELREYVKRYNISLVESVYDSKVFFEMAKGLEAEPERGKRCYECYKLRMEETAIKAKELSFDYFTTVLSISPHKNADWINEIGENLESLYKVKYLYADFKKDNGFKKSVELSNENNLYRQDYCGCIFSKKNIRNPKENI